MSSLRGNGNEPVTITDVEKTMVNLLVQGHGIIPQAAQHHLDSGGGRVRAKLALQTADALILSKETTRAISASCELLHNASLVHDDYQDGDTVRRGETAVWKKFGANTAICLGDLMVSAAYAALASASDTHLPAMITHMHKRVGDVIGGQHADLENHCRTLADYNEVARMKSGPLLGLPVELCLIAAKLSDHVSTAMAASDAIAIAYQTTDDIADAVRDSKMQGLNFLALVEGDRACRIRAANLHASKHARLAIKIAKTLPRGSGEGLIALAEKFIPILAMEGAA